MPDKMAERVLVFPTPVLREIGYFSGVNRDWKRYTDRILDKSVCGYMARSECEPDPEYKQIIPYVIMISNGQVFRYTRGKAGSEERLRSLYSVGVGGHISLDDESMFEDTYEAGMARELEEEVEIASPYEASIAGVLNDDSNEVGSVHFGIVHLFRLREPKVKRRESVVARAGFVPISTLAGEIERYETWSQLCIREIPELNGSA